MADNKKKFLNVRPGEWTSLSMFLLVIAVNMFTLEVTFIISTAGFLSEIGGDQLPILWLVDMIFILLVTVAYSYVIDRGNRVRLLQFLLLGAVLFYIGGRGLFSLGVADWISYPFLYLLAEQQLLLLPIVLWTLANDVFSMSQTLRLFPLIAAAAVIGGVLGNFLVAGSASFMADTSWQSYDLLIVNAVLLLITFIYFLAITPNLNPANRTDKTVKSVKEVLTEGWDFVSNVQSFKYLMIAMLGIGFALTLVEYHFFKLTSATFQGAAFQTFYGTFRVIQTLFVIFLQGVLSKKLIGRFGLKRVFMFLPAAAMALVSTVLLGAGLVGIVLARLFGRVFMYGLDEPARKSLQSMIPDERRGRVSAFLDGYLYASGTIAASLLLIVLLGAKQWGWLSEEVIGWVYLGGGLAAAVVAFWAANRLQKVYDTSMLNWRLARRKRRSSNIPLDL